MAQILTELPAWRALKQHQQALMPLDLRTLFANDPIRGQQFHVSASDLLLDYSKNWIIPETLTLLTQLAEQVGLAQAIEALFSGQPINFTEQRSVLHTALRSPAEQPIRVNGQDVMPAIHAVLGRMQDLTEAVHHGHWRGFSGEPITDIVNIGIGGSHLGPALVCDALQDYANTKLRCHFIANLDPDNQRDVLKQLNPAQTIFIISSKSFTSFETLINARAVQAWFNQVTGDNSVWQRHFFAVTAQQQLAQEFGILAAHIFPVWDWVGGRYSLWSAIGLPIMLQLGVANFRALLAGAYAMDQHFRYTDWAQNMPVILALIGIWQRNFLKCTSHAVIPYAYHLRNLPIYLQQADMESNGKSVGRYSNVLSYATGPVLWGAEGCNSQHAFHQLLHQGTAQVSIDFIAPISNKFQQAQQNLLLAQVLSQSQALLLGKSLAEASAELAALGMSDEQVARLAPYHVLPGNRTSNVLLLPNISPNYLGALLALYEHKIFVQGVIWQINSFDQFGVELGKQLSKPLIAAFTNPDATMMLDSSTQMLLNYCKKMLAL